MQTIRVSMDVYEISNFIRCSDIESHYFFTYMANRELDIEYVF